MGTQLSKEVNDFKAQIRNLRNRMKTIHKLVSLVDYQVELYERDAEILKLERIIPADEIKLIEVRLHHITMVLTSALDENPWTLELKNK